MSGISNGVGCLKLCSREDKRISKYRKYIWEKEESEFIVIPKNDGTVKCDIHRTISVKEPGSKKLARLRRKVEDTMNRMHLTFKKVKVLAMHSLF